MPKVALIGAGSAAFSRRLLSDLLHWPEFQGTDLRLVDIDTGRLELIEALAKKMVAQKGAGVRVTATTDRRRALEGVDYVITTLAVGFAYEQDRPDVAIPRRYGVFQTVADTTGAGGVFRYLRTAPVMLDVTRDMQRLCPDALLLNYVNPMNMLMWTISLATPHIRKVGLCHSVQGTAALLARFCGVPEDEVAHWVAGINHQAWFLQLRHHTYRGEDLYPRLREAAQQPETYEKQRVRFELFRHLGYFVTESSHHNAEYAPWFRRTLEERERYTPLSSLPSHMQLAAVNGLPQPAGNGASRGEAQAPAEALVRHAEMWDLIRQQVAGEAPIEFRPPHEYASYIMHAIETNQPYRFNGNVQNSGLITNLPPNCNVEVPILTDNTGLRPCYVGDLPSQLAALNRLNVNVHELAVRGFLTRDRESIYQACSLDPLTSASVRLDDIRPMVDELFAANARWLDGWEATAPNGTSSPAGATGHAVSNGPSRAHTAATVAANGAAGRNVIVSSSPH